MLLSNMVFAVIAPAAVLAGHGHGHGQHKNRQVNTHIGSGALSFIEGLSASFYQLDGQTTACGETFNSAEMTVALSFSMFEQYGCGAKVTVKNLNTGAEAEAICTDSCPECDGLSRMDLSRGLFEATGADASEGLFPLAYHIEKGPQQA